MATNAVSELPDEALLSRYRTIRTVQRTVLIIFAILVAAWVLLGYWRTNAPVFVATIVMGVVATISQAPTLSALRAEATRRGLTT